MKDTGPLKDNPEQAHSPSPPNEPSRRGSSAPIGLDMPRMGAEVGFQVVSEDDVPPFRASGLICLVLGLLSASAMVAWQMLVLPIAAIAFGVFALRRWHGRRAAGSTVAAIGLVLASCFGAGGLALSLAKQSTLGNQGEYFARQYLELIGNGDLALAAELGKEVSDRQVKGMNLIEAYKEDEMAKSKMEREEAQSMEQDTIELAGPNIPWEMTQSPRVYLDHGVQHVETQWVDPSGKIKEKVIVDMQWSPNEEHEIGNWHVNACYFYHETVYAPSVL